MNQCPQCRARRISRWLLAAALGWAWLQVDAAAAASIDLTPVADTFMYAARPTENYGGASAILVAANGKDPGEAQGLLRFDASAAKAYFDTAIGGPWSVTGVALKLTGAPPAPQSPIFPTQTAGAFSANWILDDGWLEGTGTPTIPTTDDVTYATLPVTLNEDLGTFSFDGTTSGQRSYTLGLASGLVDDVAKGNPISLRLFHADNQISYLFYSLSHAGAPVLTITASPVPEPGSIVLLLIGAGALLSWRRISR